MPKESGTSDRHSAPPATIDVGDAERDLLGRIGDGRFEEAHARTTDEAGTVHRQPGSEHDLARDVGLRDRGNHGPVDEPVDRSRRRRRTGATSSATAMSPSSTAVMSLKSVPDLENGVRTPATTATLLGEAANIPMRTK